MKDFNLWDLIECFGSQEDKNKLLNLSDYEYNKLDDKIMYLCKELQMELNNLY